MEPARPTCGVRLSDNRASCARQYGSANSCPRTASSAASTPMKSWATAGWPFNKPSSSSVPRSASRARYAWTHSGDSGGGAAVHAPGCVARLGSAGACAGGASVGRRGFSSTIDKDFFHNQFRAAGTRQAAQSASAGTRRQAPVATRRSSAMCAAHRAPASASSTHGCCDVWKPEWLPSRRDASAWRAAK